MHCLTATGFTLMKMMTRKMIEELTPNTLRKMREEYSELPDIMESEDSAVTLWHNFNSLPEPDRIILMIYSETASERITAKLLGVSRTTIRKLLTRIKAQMKQNI